MEWFLVMGLLGLFVLGLAMPFPTPMWSAPIYMKYFGHKFKFYGEHMAFEVTANDSYGCSPDRNMDAYLVSGLELQPGYELAVVANDCPGTSVSPGEKLWIEGDILSISRSGNGASDSPMVYTLKLNHGVIETIDTGAL